MGKRERVDRPMSYARTLTKVGCAWCIEATVPQHRLYFEGFVARMAGNSPLKTALKGKLEGGARCSGEQEFDWLKRLQKDLTEFRTVTNNKGVGSQCQESSGVVRQD